MENKILIVDIETTGFFKQNGKIVEVGIVELDIKTGNKEIIFNQVVHERPITQEEVQNSWIVVNGFMTVEEIRSSPELKTKITEIQEIFNKYTLGTTAYNNAFDFEFLEDRGIMFPNKLPCPMKVCTNLCKLPGKYGSFKWPKVPEAYDYLFPNNDYEEIHRGADDAFNEADIVYELIKMDLFKIEKVKQ